MAIWRVLKWYEKSWFNIRGGDVDKLLEEESVDGVDLFQYEFSLIVSSSFHS